MEWKFQFYLKFGEWVFWVGVVVLGMVIVLGIVVLGLNEWEKWEDERDRQWVLYVINFQVL